jgi:hypothetical protein
VRVRLSPMIPVRGWRAEYREMLRLLFSRVRPDVVTMEPIRYLHHSDLQEKLDLSLLDEEFLEAMRAAEGEPHAPGCEVPDSYRAAMYDYVWSIIEKEGPSTPVAFCREKRTLWETFGERMARHGQNPDLFFCNCGPYCAPAAALAGSPA